MKIKLSIIFYVLGIVFPAHIQAQNYLWNHSIDLGRENETILSSVITNDNEVISVGYDVPINETFPIILKFDSTGDTLWSKRINYDIIPSGRNTLIRKIGNTNQFYICGEVRGNGIWYNDFIAKVDSNADSIWVRKFNYTSFYNSVYDAVVLPDESIITIGQVVTAFQNDIICKRVDSSGNTLWEKIYNISNSQIGLGIELLMDGSLVYGAVSKDFKLLVIRADINGDVIDSVTYLNRYADLLFLDINVLPDNKIGIAGRASMGSTRLGGYLAIIDQNLQMDYYSFKGNEASWGPDVIEDSTLVVSILDAQDSLVLDFSNLNGMTTDSLKYSALNDSGRIALDRIYTKDGLILTGYTLDTDGDYWIAKYPFYKEKWIPEPCLISIPDAGFDFTFSDPLLTLKDTSYSGVKYLDSIFSWQWNTSVGNFNLGDSLTLFIDTTTTKTLDVELIVSNWYGCTDTIQKTLNFGPNGIREIKNERLKIYPNPARNLVNFKLSNANDQNYTLSICDLKGVLVEEIRLSDSNVHYDVSKLKSGMYIYKLNAASGPIRGKLLIKD